MKILYVLFSVIGIIWGDVRTCNILCQPSDEFEDGETTTTEWDYFMEMLTLITTSRYSWWCDSDPNKEFTVDWHDDIIWDLRFKIYSERQNIEEKTLNDCYCDHNDCQSEEFRQCLKEARTAMLGDVESMMTNTISEYVQSVAANC